MPRRSRAATVQDPPVIADWLEALAHQSPFEAHGDGPASDKSARPFTRAAWTLMPLLQDPDARVRLEATKELGTLAGEIQTALPQLRAALKKTALKDVDERVRTQAARALLQAGPEPASTVAALIDSLGDELDLVRFHAAIALGDLGRDARAAVPALIHIHVWDEDPAVRVEAAIALWKIDQKSAIVIPALIKGLAEKNELICWMAADCLGRIGPEAKEALPALRQAMGRDFQLALVRSAIGIALERIDPEAA